MSIITPAALKALADKDIDNFIAASEAAGQKTFVVAETLPRLCPREQLEELGFVFGEVVDDVFIHVVFPEG